MYCRLRIYWITDVRDVFKSFIHFFDVFHLTGKGKSHIMIRGVVQKRRIFGRSGLNPLYKICIIAVARSRSVKQKHKRSHQSLYDSRPQLKTLAFSDAWLAHSVYQTYHNHTTGL